VDTLDAAAGAASRAADLSRKYSPEFRSGSTAPPAPAAILAALGQFMEVVRYLNTRRSQNTLALDSEAAVQDAVYLMLRPWVVDLVPETPTERIANRFTIKDFVSATANTIVEAKFIRDKDHGKGVTKEIHDDIETYRHDPRCNHLIFFIYDPDAMIPDQAALRRQIETRRVYDEKQLICHLVLAP
jgi:hypothetical protein